MKDPNPPGSGKDIVEGKGVHCEVESEGSRMRRMSCGANLWPDEQEPYYLLRNCEHEGQNGRVERMVAKADSGVHLETMEETNDEI